jgi:predicted lipoprotein with Yx(FWY)xxD motif
MSRIRLAAPTPGITARSAAFRQWKAHGGRIRIALGVSAMLLGGCAVFALSQVPVKRDGNALVDAAGMTLYTFDRDPLGKSACYAQCAANWPPLVAPAGAKPAGDYTILARDDGRRQWAYKGKPLYVRSKDEKPGDQGGEAFDNVWRVARP